MEMIVIPRLSHNNNGVRKAKKKRAQTVNPSGAEQKKKKNPAGALALYRRIQISIDLIHTQQLCIIYASINITTQAMGQKR